MSVDYTALAATAASLIQANGRTITVVRWNQTAADSAKPWKGPTDPRISPDASSSVKAVAVPGGMAGSLGLKSIDEELVKRTYQFLLVEPGSYDFTTANEVIDADNTKKRITFVQMLKPGDTVLLYFIGVEK